MQTIVVLLVLSCAVTYSVAMIFCRPGICGKMSRDCADVSNCEGRVDPHGGFCGCCPACLEQRDLGESCQNILLGAPRSFECAEGLECDTDSWQCVRKSCETLKAEAEAFNLMGTPTPICDADGTYSHAQQTGSIIRCVDKQGQTIEGYGNIPVGNYGTCYCARDAHEYALTGMIGKWFMCRPNGSYESRQCLGSVCFCSDEHGQQIAGSDGVFIGEMNSLNC